MAAMMFRLIQDSSAPWSSFEFALSKAKIDQKRLGGITGSTAAAKSVAWSLCVRVHQSGQKKVCMCETYPILAVSYRAMPVWFPGKTVCVCSDVCV